MIQVGRAEVGGLTAVQADGAPAEVDLLVLVQVVARRYWDEIVSRQAFLVIDDDLPTVRADHAALEAVFDELLKNALRHGCDSANPRIAVGCIARGREMRVFVHDNGPGVPAHCRDKVFRGEYQRLRKGWNNAGRGLATVRRHVDALGGRVWLESREGTGAKFVVALPDDLVVPSNPAVPNERRMTRHAAQPSGSLVFCDHMALGWTTFSKEPPTVAFRTADKAAPCRPH